MFTRSTLRPAGDVAHRVIVGFGLGVIAVVAFANGVAILTAASSATPMATLAVGAASLLVCIGALAWLTSLFLGGTDRP